MRLVTLAPLAFASFALVACAPKKDAPKPNVDGAAQATAAAGSTAAAAAALPVLGPAPSWQLKSPDGKVVSSDEFKGKVVVVDFWATWCPPCRSEIPGYVDLYRKYGKDGLAIVGVSLDEAGPGVVQSFMKKFGVNYPIVMGTEQIQDAFGGMDAIPTTFLIDRDGRIRDKKVGAEPTEEYEQKIKSVL